MHDAKFLFLNHKNIFFSDKYSTYKKINHSQKKNDMKLKYAWFSFIPLFYLVMASNILWESCFRDEITIFGDGHDDCTG